MLVCKSDPRNWSDDVYAIYHLYTKKHKLHDINAKASRPRRDLLKTIMEEINRFCARPDSETPADEEALPASRLDLDP